MGVAIKKVNCPNPDHPDNIASCAVYEDGSGFCFGCQTYFKSIAEPVNQTVFKEDINAKIDYIRSLPTKQIRGLDLPYDDKGYYILWPNANYYKLRYWDDNNARGRYGSPSGHTKPLFTLYSGDSSEDTLVLVEGEINALSLFSSGIVADVVSPGGVTGFTDKLMINELPTLINYAKVIVIADADAAGLEASIKFKTLARQYNSSITIKLMEEDFNQILVEHGKEGIKETIEDLGVL